MAHVARALMVNPAPKRAKSRKQGREAMAAKKRRRRARKKSGNPSKKRTTRRRKRRALAASPAPRRRHKRRVRRANPSRRRHVGFAPRRHKRRHRRNPGLPLWAQLGVAATLGIAGFAIAQVSAYAVTQRTDPSFATIQRNNIIAGALVGAAGIFLALKKKPLLGVALAAGGLAAGGGGKARELLAKLVPAPTATAQLGAVYGQDGMAAVHQLEGYETLQGYEQLSAVYGQDGF
jgi:hypothetical protein